MSDKSKLRVLAALEAVFVIAGIVMIAIGGHHYHDAYNLAYEAPAQIVNGGDSLDDSQSVSGSLRSGLVFISVGWIMVIPALVVHTVRNDLRLKSKRSMTKG